jgi:hypothetical protein
MVCESFGPIVFLLLLAPLLFEGCKCMGDEN